jgi:membrane protease YdiL (CAAX protease family)
LVSGVTEELGFRGYMQRGLERFGTQTAIVVTACFSFSPMPRMAWRPS